MKEFLVSQWEETFVQISIKNKKRSDFKDVDSTWNDSIMTQSQHVKAYEYMSFWRECQFVIETFPHVTTKNVQPRWPILKFLGCNVDTILGTSIGLPWQNETFD